MYLLEFSVTARPTDGAEPVSARRRIAFAEGSRGWTDIEADLTSLAGRTVALELATRVKGAGADGESAAFPLWGAPRIVAPAIPRMPALLADTT